MKANEAPEKIYLIRNISTSTSLNTTNDCHEKYLQEWYKGREKDTDIEYIHTDAFIEKACEWMKNRGCLYIKYTECGTGFDNEQFIKDFRKAMKGE